MAIDRIHRNARRGIAVAVLGWLSVAAAAVVLAPPAGAAPAVTVPIRDLTPPVVSVDGGGTVTFVNEIQDKTVQVGGGGLLPTLVSVTAKTEVTLGLPSGQRVLAPGASVSEQFAGTCLTCSITYTYKLQSNASVTAVLTDAVTKLLPPLPAPTPFVVNTLIPLPNLPGINLPQLPPLTLPAPPAGGLLPTPPSAQPNTPTVPGAVTPPVAAPEQPAGPVVEGAPGSQYTYATGAGAAQLSPGAGSAAAAFDPARFLASRNATGSAGTGSGSGGLAGSYDGATVPVFGQLAGLNGSGLDDDGEALDTTADTASTATPLPAAALAAVVALAAASAALVRTHQASRASR